MMHRSVRALMATLGLGVLLPGAAHAQGKTTPECAGITGPKESTDLIYFGQTGGTQYVLCGVVYTDEGNESLARIELRTRVGTQPFVTRHAAGLGPDGKTVGAPFNLNSDATDTFLWIAKGTVTYALHDCSNPRQCGDDDDYVASLGVTPVNKGRCGRAAGFPSARAKAVACDLQQRLLEEIKGNEQVISVDDQGELAISPSHAHLFKKTATVPPAVMKVVYP